MNMNLSNEYQTHGNEVKYNRGTTTNLSNTNGLHNTQSVSMPSVLNAGVGQVITGEIIDMTPGTVQLLLQDQSVLQARVEGNVNVSLHSLMSFEVGSTKANQLLLRPLYLNTANNQTLLKALEAAGIPQNDKTIELVTNQMEANRPIDKATLQRIYQQISEYPEAKVSDILALRELGLPINQNNLTQFSTCMNLQETFSNTYLELENQIMAAIHEIAEKGDTERLNSFVNSILRAFTGVGNIGQETPYGNLSPETAGNAAGMSGGNPGVEAGVISGMIQSAGGEAMPNTASLSNPVAESSMVATEDSAVQKVLIQSEQENTGQQEAVAKEVLSESSVQNLIKNQPQNSMSFPVSIEEFTPEKFQRTLRNLMEQNLMWDIESVAEDSKDTIKSMVKQLYNKVMSTTEALSNMDLNEFPEAKALQKSAGQTMNQVQFLNDLNQSIMYLQIPLKQSGALKDGHLHVYSRNKKLNSKEDEITALIHLDMEHLGPVSVHVSLKDSRIGTKFYLKDEATILFISEHIGMLDKRIRDRGYDFHAEMTEQRKEYQPEKLLQSATGMDGEGNGGSCIGQYSFDVRA